MPSASAQQIVDLLTALVAVDSTNPTLVPDGNGEAAIARHIAEWFAATAPDVEVVVDEVAPGRPNVIARRRGTGGGRTLLLNAHVDTVGVQGMDAPFRATRDGDRLLGRGTCDMKAGLAVGMLAVANAAPRRGDVVLTAVIDEEHSSLGSAAAAATVPADGVIVLEASGLDVHRMHKGFAWVEVLVEGTAAHGARYDLGVDAVVRMGAVLEGVAALAADLTGRPPHPVLGCGSIHVGTISGGSDMATYPDRCVLALERRLLPGEDGDTARAEVQAILDDVRRRYPDLRAGCDVTLVRHPLDGALDDPFVGLVAREVTAVTGAAPPMGGHAGWTDAALFAERGVPSLVFGAIGGELHAPGEWVDVPSVVTSLEVVERVAERFCA